MSSSRSAQLRRRTDRPWVVAAFTGWNDAASASSDALAAVIEHCGATEIATIDSEEYFDFQATRPVMSMMEDVELLTWPATTIWRGQVDDGAPVLCVSGPEPNLRWRQYCDELLDLLIGFQPEGIVVLGAMVTDVPHTRPLPVSGSASDHGTASRLGIEKIDYSGPVGMPSILVTAARARGVNAVGLWASVPQYAYEPPCPPAVQALLLRVEELTGLAVPAQERTERSREWMSALDQAADETEGLREYISALEAERDADLPEGITGDVLAVEFQSYLRHRRADGGR
ncbi:proteasome assembly chaperone family protein [Acidipropionibacterium timonense]|uniref:proteasome assembly chaperone family protein n=1 Tax=Acidipropionibacterium timonense TaxID=2161818 RepID=UPI00103064E6|nr:PAC2 family protein [Acidipropionibacterium timonense]